MTGRLAPSTILRWGYGSGGLVGRPASHASICWHVLSTGYPPNTCSITHMAVPRPNWWCYPERCANGHEWGPGLITVSWVPCECGPAAAAREHGPGHVVVYSEAVKGCRSARYQPRHEPER
jgi:hypothetical protein